MNEKKAPIIGLTPQIDYDTGMYKIAPHYTDCLARAGAIPLLLPFTKDQNGLSHLLALCDGILLTGGHDIHPSYYGEDMHEFCNSPVSSRDTLEMQLIPMALERKKPIFAICRGIQALNVALGGTLYQDINAQGATDLSHRLPDTPAAHSVTCVKDTLAAELFGTEPVSVNSLHHQAIKDLGQGLSVAAYSEDGLVEAVHLPSHPFVFGVQWHPELLAAKDPNQFELFRRFVAAC